MRSVDAAVGVLLDRLMPWVSDNTLVIFTSDNGAVSGTPGGRQLNAPLRGKEQPVRRGHRVPLIARSQHIPMALSATMVVTHDLHPTLLHWAGLDEEQRNVPDGLDISAALLGQQDQLERFIVWHSHTARADKMDASCRARHPIGR